MAAQEPTPGDRLFALQVWPLLEAKCLGCHGNSNNDIEAGLDLSSRETLLQGGESGDPSLIPGDPDRGLLLDAVRWIGLEMPPKESERLTEAEIDSIRKWIAAGAPWPSDDVQREIRRLQDPASPDENEVTIATSGGLSSSWTDRRYDRADLWAFAPLPARNDLVPSELPPHDAIDWFIDQRLAQAGLTGLPSAEPETLVRRVYLDVTGLPPTYEEIARFAQDWRRDPDSTWDELIERLLASPRYGEHWGRHWLDVTRYADTGGMSNDFERSNMWRYRDYVIRSFNDDRPYDQFVIEQLAGDELADAAVLARCEGDASRVEQIQLSGEYTEQEAEWIVASGVLRLGPWDNAMIDAAEARQIYLDDLVNITGQTFLSQTLRCCKCHDHKFDPIPTRDYYRIYAAFATTQMAERPVPFLSKENLAGMEQGEEHVRSMLEFAIAEKNRILEKQEAAARTWYAERGLPYVALAERQGQPDEAKPPRHIGLSPEEQGQLKVREQDEWIWTRRLERYQPMAQSVYNAYQAPLAWNGARKLRIARTPSSTEPIDCHILLGGSLSATGEVVRPGVLSAVNLPAHADANDPYLLVDGVAGRRLDLARWITDPRNGLAARSIVNRVWQFHLDKAWREHEQL
ncbi:MAG: DUF1549 domain-containing protein [Pirellulaceae bacterium]